MDVDILTFLRDLFKKKPEAESLFVLPDFDKIQEIDVKMASATYLTVLFDDVIQYQTVLSKLLMHLQNNTSFPTHLIPTIPREVSLEKFLLDDKNRPIEHCDILKDIAQCNYDILQLHHKLTFDEDYNYTNKRITPSIIQHTEHLLRDIDNFGQVNDNAKRYRKL